MNREVQYANELHQIDFSADLLTDNHFIAELQRGIKKNNIYIFKNVLHALQTDIILNYLKGLARHSFPSYHSLVLGCPDFHRVCDNDARSVVKSIMHQFVFHPWNQNVLNLFNLMRPVYYLRNLIGGFDKESFLANTGNSEYAARLAFHCYPIGGGYMQKHSDPIGEHQLAAAVMQLSEKGIDYESGGLHLWKSEISSIDVDLLMKPGDVIFFNAQTPHSVESVDPSKERNWLDFKGRWMMLAAIVKTAQNIKTSDSVVYA